MVDQQTPTNRPLPKQPRTLQASPAAIGKIVGGALAVVVVVLIGLDSLVPSRWRVETSILINASPSTVHAVVGDLNNWGQWAQWDASNLGPTNVIGERSKGKGATLAWTSAATGPGGAPILGRVTILRTDPLQGIWFESTLDGRAPSPLSLTYEPRLGATEVTWISSGSLSQPLAGLSVSRYQTQLQEHMEAGLLRLKATTEGIGPD